MKGEPIYGNARPCSHRRNPMHGIRRQGRFTAYAYAGAFKISCESSSVCSARLHAYGIRCGVVLYDAFANIAFKAFRCGETSTGSRHCRSTRRHSRYSATLHDVDVGLAHALTSGIVTHVDTLGPLLFLGAHTKGTPKSNSKKDGKQHS